MACRWAEAFFILKLERDILLLGGLASRGELLGRGHLGDMIDLAAEYGRVIVRVRKGWYAVPDMPDLVMGAWRAGGRLSCVSAAGHYGLKLPHDGALHVNVPRNASRLRHTSDLLVRHWSDRQTLHDQRGPDRSAVSLELAIRQVFVCARAKEAAASLWQSLGAGAGQHSRDSL